MTARCALYRPRIKCEMRKCECANWTTYKMRIWKCEFCGAKRWVKCKTKKMRKITQAWLFVCIRRLLFLQIISLPHLSYCSTVVSWAVSGYAHAPFSPKFLMAFCSDGMDPMNTPAKFEVCSFTRSRDNSGYLKTLDSPWIRRSRSSMVVDFGTNRKRVCDFLLVRHTAS